MISPISYKKGILQLIDQRLLPNEAIWLEYNDLEKIAIAIEQMVVRGAPAIGCTAAFALAIDARNFNTHKKWEDYKERFHRQITRLSGTRPTAVNLFFALERAMDLGVKFPDNLPMSAVANKIEELANSLYEDDLSTCRAIGQNGLSMVPSHKISILTHCNAGSLATAGYGTAIGVIRAVHAAGLLNRAFVDETRPWLQGARLTSFELQEEKIPHTLIVDSSAGYLMKLGKIDWIVVGADRIAANGDTANKIGTYSLAVNARHHGLKFFIAAPLSTFDSKLKNGSQIPIEERPAEEITEFRGASIAPKGTIVFNPSFDVTPHELISGIITEKGVLTPPFESKIKDIFCA